MAVTFPSYLDALIEGFPPAFKATNVIQHEYIEASQNVGEFIDKLFGRLSVLLFNIDKQINKVLIQGRLLPKKLNLWVMEARTIKYQVNDLNDLLKEQLKRKDVSLECEVWVEIAIRMINHLKKCPFKDEKMYDKPIPVIIQNPESSSEKPGRILEEKYKVEEEQETEQSLSSVRSHGVRQNQDAGSPEIIKNDKESTQVLDLLSFQEEHYLVVVEVNHLQFTFDNQIILVEDFPSPVPPDSSPMNAVLNFVEQDLRELPQKPSYHTSLILFLQRNKRLTHIHPSFFDSLPDLRFLDLSDTKISILPSSLFRLSKLKVLLLRNCVCLENIPHEIGKLNHMEALDLSGTELYELPDEIGQLRHLRSMQLSFYGPDDESEYEHLPSRLVSPSVLSELTEIRVLSISVHPEDHRWTEIAACMIKEVSKLEMLSYLHFYFPEVKMFEKFIQMSPSWDKQIVRKFDFIVGQNVKRIASRVPDEVESLFNQQERCLRYVNGDNASPFIKAVLIRVTAFYLDHHTEVQSLSEFDISNFQALKFCVVRECPKIQAILDEKNAASAFPCLEHLGIYFLWELKHIWKPSSPAWRLNRIFRIPSPSGNFKALRCLIINTCPMLQFILWESMLQCLSNLEELVVEDCERLEKIIKEEKKKVKYEGSVLPGLKKLVLHYLPELVTLGDGVCLSEEKLSVYGCPKLILNSQP